MKRSICIAAAVAAFGAMSAIPASAQAIRPPSPIGGTATSGITVHGHAEIKRRPDVAYVSLGVVTQGSDQQAAVGDNAKRVKAVLASLKKSGVADKDIQTQYYTVQPQYDYNASPAVLTGYQVQNTVRATVRDLSKAGATVDAATAAGATQVEGLEFSLSDRATAEGAALSAAIANARAKADLMAGAAGVDLGRILSINDGFDASPGPIVYGGVRTMAASAAAPPTPIAPQDITLTADVTLVYAIGYPH